MKRVLVTEHIHKDGLALFEQQPDIAVEHLHGDIAKLPDAIARANAVLVRSMQLDRGVLERASQLEIVSRHGVGCDNIDIDYLTNHRIPVAIATNANATSVVEHVLSLMLALSKELFQYDKLVRAGRFSERGAYPTSELHGKRVLIIGFGRIGSRVAPVLKGLGMKVTVADIALNRELADAIGVKAVDDFRPELAVADYVTLHVPLNETTHHLISTAELDALPPHAIVINCARGGVVDEQAMAAAIRNESIAAHGCDVFSSEPPAANNPLLNLPNCLLTPHTAAAPEESMQRMATFSAQNILDYFNGKLASEMLFNSV